MHRVSQPALDVSLVCGRPFSLGGPELTFGPELHGSYGVGSLEDSAKRLCELVDQAEIFPDLDVEQYQDNAYAAIHRFLAEPSRAQTSA